jgi:hypothetical protein
MKKIAIKKIVCYEKNNPSFSSPYPLHYTLGAGTPRHYPPGGGTKWVSSTRSLYGFADCLPFRPRPGVFVVNVLSNLSEQIERIVVF